jgi:hypothetical protein
VLPAQRPLRWPTNIRYTIMRRTLIAVVGIALLAGLAIYASSDPSLEGSPRTGQPAAEHRATEGGLALTRETVLAEASDTIERLAAASAEAPQVGDAAEPAADAEWQQYSREPGLGRLMSDVRCSGRLNFRSPDLNAADTYIPSAVRDRFASEIQKAVSDLERLKELKFQIAREQVLELAANKLFRKDADGVWRIGEWKPADKGGGWHSVMLDDGIQYQVRWKDLTSAQEVATLSQFLEQRLYSSVVEFFASVGVLDKQKRDAIQTFWLNGGEERLRALAASDPAQYRYLLRLIHGR